uniref:DX domain-containing protein n=1 Tax=Caenorhabditis japonica TaxID=281687 RepID=A0A8R1DR07_CAEJA
MPWMMMNQETKNVLHVSLTMMIFFTAALSHEFIQEPLIAGLHAAQIAIYPACIRFTSQLSVNTTFLLALGMLVTGIGQVLGSAMVIVLGSPIRKKGEHLLVIFALILHSVLFLLIGLSFPNDAPFGHTDKLGPVLRATLNKETGKNSRQVSNNNRLRIAHRSNTRFHVKMTHRLAYVLLLFLFLNGVRLQSSTEEPATDPPAAAATDPPAAGVTDPPAAAPPAAGPQATPPSQTLCPTGNAHTTEDCSKQYGSCGNGAECFRDFVRNGQTHHGCCGQLNGFCPATKMHAYHSNGTGSHKFGVDGSTAQTHYKRNYIDAGINGVACPYPYAFSLNVDHRKVLPVGFDEDQAAQDQYTQTPCSKVSDCKSGEFCGAVWNPTFVNKNMLDASTANGGPLHFCYEFPKPEPDMEHVSIPVDLKVCNVHADCGNEYEVCHIESGKPYMNASNPLQNPPPRGICMTVKACKGSSYKQTGMTVNVNNEFCQQDADCEGAGLARSNANHDPKCVGYLASDTTRKLCCFKNLPTCSAGNAKTPLQKCTKTADCNPNWPHNATNFWCNDIGEKHCCRDHTNTLWQCPDLATPLFNEPLCKGYDKSNPTSGSCPKKGGICRYGHCCPGFVVGNNNTDSKLGQHHFETEFPCDPKKPLPSQFAWSFCNSETKKIIVVGLFHANGDKLTEKSSTQCDVNDDCSPDGSSVCVYKTNKEHTCFYNPLRPLRPQVSGFWKVILIISLICGVIFLICSIIFFVCYRSKSVFDKYTPKKKKKKGGKDDKDSKDSNKSSTKEGKDKKKKKKKGKGDESSGGSSKDEKTDATGTSESKSQIN